MENAPRQPEASLGTLWAEHGLRRHRLQQEITMFEQSFLIEISVVQQAPRQAYYYLRNQAGLASHSWCG